MTLNSNYWNLSSNNNPQEPTTSHQYQSKTWCDWKMIGLRSFCLLLSPSLPRPCSDNWDQFKLSSRLTSLQMDSFSVSRYRIESWLHQTRSGKKHVDTSESSPRPHPQLHLSFYFRSKRNWPLLALVQLHKWVTD